MFGNFLAAGLGGAIGAMLRYGISLLCMSIHWSSHMATFSTFSVQSLSLIQEGRWGMAALYILGTLIICIFCAWLGCLAGQKLS